MSRYNLNSLDEPVLTGTGLRLFATALGNPVLRPLLLPRMMRSGGLPRLRSLRLHEPPTHQPLYPAGDVPFDAAEAGQLADPALLEVGASLSGFCTVRDLARAYRQGQTTPLAVTERLLDGLATSDAGERPLRAFIAFDRDQLLAQAEGATRRIKAGNDLGIFDGIPVACKDEFDVAGYPTTVGTRFLGKTPAREDATVAARLRQAGAVIVGKTNMHEIGINPRSGNPHHGTVRNPYDLDRDAGGSSSGSAAAVAAGLCPLAIGADGGGSIRIPAALCGVVGLKATYGRISSHGSFPLDWSVGHLGPIGATVDDVALAYAAIAGPDPRDPNTLRQPPLNLGRCLEAGAGDGRLDLRVGVYREWFNHAEPEIVSCCEGMLDEFAGRGATVVEIEIPELDESRIAHAVTILSEMATSMADYPEHWRDLSAPTRINLTIGRAASAVDYLQAQRVRTRAMAVFADIFTGVDVVLSPATAILAPPIPPDSLSHGLADLGSVTELMRFAVPGNMTGLPAITFPVGYDRAGLPIAMQAMGRPWEEGVLLRIAGVAEKLLSRKLPGDYVDLLAAVDGGR
jgi:Asp-tRNA(Asn)/Glu-tRNA(Gln) amidotransferase A subunit family amidase